MSYTNMALPKLDYKHSQQKYSIGNIDQKISSSYNHSVTVDSTNTTSTHNVQQNDDYSFPVITSNGAEVDANLSALNYTRTHSYRNSSIKMSDSTRSSRVRKRSSIDTVSNAGDRNSMPSIALTPKEALALYKDHLTEFERTEILNYPAIYFVGQDVEKLNVQSEKDYCDENGSYRKVRYDHIAYRYEVFETLGSGSFGMVVKCFDHKYKELVALKIIRNRKKLEQQGMVEVKLLTHLRNLDKDERYNIVHTKEYFYFRNHLCITFELLGMNLYEVIKKNQFQGFSSNLVRKFAYAILQCLKLLYRERIIHCDLKPENILIRQKNKNSTSCSLKVCDFGSGTFENEKIYTYIQSRFYRAPEVILGIPYTTGIDVWSLGCILAELFTGQPLFPGNSETDQLHRIIEVVGMPSHNILDQSTRSKLFFDSRGLLKESKSARRIKPESKPLRDIFKDADLNFIDFLSRCLEWDPDKRMRPEEALKHPWILEAKLQKHNSVKQGKRPKHRLKRDDSSYGGFNNQNYINNNMNNNTTMPDEDTDYVELDKKLYFPPI